MAEEHQRVGERSQEDSSFERLTEDLLERLLASASPEAYLDQGVIIDRELPEYLDELRHAHGDIKKSQIIHDTGLNGTFVYDIFTGKSKPRRDNAIMLAFGIGCTLRECQRLLRLAGVSELWPKVRRDAIIIWCIDRGMSRTRCDEELWRMGERTLFGTGVLPARTGGRS